VIDTARRQRTSDSGPSPLITNPITVDMLGHYSHLLKIDNPTFNVLLNEDMRI
jgi:hypothetical protein